MINNIPRVRTIFYGPEQIGADDNGYVTNTHLSNLKVLGKLIQKATQKPGGKKEESINNKSSTFFFLPTSNNAPFMEYHLYRRYEKLYGHVTS